PASATLMLLYFFFDDSAPHRHLHSFPTRRSSDLYSTSAWGRRLPATVAAWARAWRRFASATAISVFAASAMSTRRSSPTLPNWVDRKSTRLNSSHVEISYAVFCLKKKKTKSKSTSSSADAERVPHSETVSL